MRCDDARENVSLTLSGGPGIMGHKLVENSIINLVAVLSHPSVGSGSRRGYPTRRFTLQKI